MEASLQKRIKEHIMADAGEPRFKTHNDPFWSKLIACGTTLWLDTGDMEEAEQVLTNEMHALTTNNTLINKVVQKGIYDDYIVKSKELVSSLPFESQVVELAFILNARHGLRLVNRFGVEVSVELHTNCSHNIDEIVSYGLRYHEICPYNFIIKVPYTAAGLIGARKLKEHGVRINFTLGFSARQNVLAAYIARPDYLNVFLGRIGAYISDNNLGTGSFAGEKSVIETQRTIKRICRNNSLKVKLIAASLRHHDQLEALSGVDLYTMPPAIARQGRLELKGDFSSQLDTDYQPRFEVDPVSSGIIKFWKISPDLERLAAEIGNKLPEYGDEIVKRFSDAGFGDMFPSFNEEETAYITSDGKIPKYQRWKERIKIGELAPDTLLNISGLASFTVDQAAFDSRIERMIS